jgi:hypothetical protein
MTTSGGISWSWRYDATDQGPSATRLAVGDTLLLQGSWDALDDNLDHPDVLVVDSPELVRRQAVPLGPGGRRAAGALVARVVLVATGGVPVVIAGLVADARGSDGAGLPCDQLVGRRFHRCDDPTDDGGADDRRRRTTRPCLRGPPWGLQPYLLLLGVAVITLALGQLISNMAAALIVIPIALSAAAELGVFARPLMMCVTVAAAAAFLTPISTRTNLVVMGPGGYRFGDYWRLGLPLLLLFLAVATFLVPVFWHFCYRHYL